MEPRSHVIPPVSLATFRHLKDTGPTEYKYIQKHHGAKRHLLIPASPSVPIRTYFTPVLVGQGFGRGVHDRGNPKHRGDR